MIREDARRFGLQMPKDLRLAYETVREQQRVVNARRRHRYNNQFATPRYAPKFVVGQSVLIHIHPALDGRSKKFLPTWAPGEVVRKIARDVYVVQNLWTGRTTVAHVQRLLPRVMWSRDDLSAGSPWARRGEGFLEPPKIRLRDPKLTKKKVQAARRAEVAKRKERGQPLQTRVDTRSKRRRVVQPLQRSDGTIVGWS